MANQWCFRNMYQRGIGVEMATWPTTWAESGRRLKPLVRLTVASAFALVEA